MSWWTSYCPGCDSRGRVYWENIYCIKFISLVLKISHIDQNLDRRIQNSLQWKCFETFCYEIAENSKKTIHSRITPWICNFDLFVTFMRALKRWWILKISKISIFEEEKIICDTWFYTRCTWLWLKLEIFWNFFEHNNWMFNDPSKVTLVFLFCKNYFGPAQVQMVVISISL